jgi:hypothetical protein
VLLHAPGDTAAQVIERVSVASNGQQANPGVGGVIGLSGDGRFVAFGAISTNLAAPCPGGGIFVRDRATGITTCDSLTPGGLPALTLRGGALSADGRFLAFQSTDLAFNQGCAGTPAQIFHSFVVVRDRVAATTSCIALGFGFGDSTSTSR